MAALDWESGHVAGPSLRLFCAALPKRTFNKAKIKEVCSILVWSFQQLLRGTYPTTDHLGQPWPEGSPRASDAGLPIADGYKGVWPQLVQELCCSLALCLSPPQT